MVRKAMRDLAFCAEEVVLIGDSGADRGAAGVTGYACPRGQALLARRTISAMPLIARACLLSGAALCD
jgi:hypothetical protein